jgi:hypothetical protein
MKWEIGKEYKCRNGSIVTLVAFHSDGRLICDKARQLVYRNPDGTYIGPNGRRFDGYNIINPDEPTAEERERLARILDAFGFRGAATLVRTYGTYVHGTCFPKALEALREGR